MALKGTRLELLKSLIREAVRDGQSFVVTQELAESLDVKSKELTSPEMYEAACRVQEISESLYVQGL